MPTPEQILDALTEIANRWRGLAIGWHLYFGAILVALLVGARPSRRVVGVLLALPLLSVSALAWATGNSFNGLVFLVVAVAAALFSLTGPTGEVCIGRLWAVVVGALLLAFGWTYPHFLHDGPLLRYLYSAPTGLVPCPTLAAVIGLGLIVDGLGSRGWCLLLGATGLFYALFGALRLGVRIDAMLLVGAVAISALAIRKAATRGVAATR